MDDDEFWSRCRTEVAKAFATAGHDLYISATDPRVGIQGQVRHDVMEALAAQQVAEWTRRTYA